MTHVRLRHVKKFITVHKTSVKLIIFNTQKQNKVTSNSKNELLASRW